MIAHAIDIKRHSKGRDGKPVSPHTVEICKVKLGHFARILGPALPLIDFDDAAFARWLSVREKEPGATKGSTVKQHELHKEVQQLRFALRLQKGLGNYPHDIDRVTRLRHFAVGYEPRKRHLSWETLPAFLASIIRGSAGTVTWETLELARHLRDEGRPITEVAEMMDVSYATAHRYLRMRLAEPRETSIVHAQHAAWLITTATRLKESYRAEMWHHDLVNWRVYIDGKKTAKSDGTIPIAPVFRDILEWSLTGRPKTGPLFPKWSNIHRALYLACDRAGIDRLSPNDLRRTHTTLLGKAGVPNSELIHISRHTTTAMLDKVYVHHDLESIERRLAEVKRPALPTGRTP